MKTLEANIISVQFRCILLISMLIAFLQACDKSESDPQPSFSITISSNPELGEFLVDKDGKTLYIFSKDIDGASTCSGGCIDNWPFFYDADLALGSGLDANDFGVITRLDGQKQTTYKGWPLYRFKGDATAGDTAGDGLGTTWFVANPNYTLFVADKGSDKFLVDDKGRTLYNFGNDTENVSNCNGKCAEVWPVFFSTKITVPSLLKKTDFVTITRSDNADQLTYQTKALYYFSKDTKRGDIIGKNVNNFTLAPLSVNH